MNRIFIIGVLIFGLFTAPCFASGKAKQNVWKGNILYNNGNFEDAIKKYEEALSTIPDSTIVNFDLGAGLYKIGNYKEAIGHFERAVVTDDPALEQKASYNAANAKYKYGISKEDTDIPVAVDLLRQSLRHYERAIELDREDKNAKYNYEFVKNELKRLEEKLKKQQQESQKENKGQEEQKGQQPQQQQPQQQPQQAQQQGQQQANGQKKEKEQEKTGETIQGQEPQDMEKEPLATPRGEKQLQGEMSKQEAKSLLENYKNEEEPQELLKEDQPVRGLREPQKDW